MERKEEEEASGACNEAVERGEVAAERAELMGKERNMRGKERIKSLAFFDSKEDKEVGPET